MKPYNRNDIYMTQECWGNSHRKCKGVFFTGKCGCLCHKLPNIDSKNKPTDINRGNAD